MNSYSYRHNVQKIIDDLPGLDPVDYFRLALACLDQAGLTVEEQNKVAGIGSEHNHLRPADAVQGFDVNEEKKPQDDGISDEDIDEMITDHEGDFLEYKYSGWPIHDRIVERQLQLEEEG